MTGSTIHQRESTLAGRRVMFVGKLASMSRRDAERLIREGGGQLVDRADKDVDLIVASDETADAKRLAADRDLFDDHLRARIAGGDVEVLHESDLWARFRPRRVGARNRAAVYSGNVGRVGPRADRGHSAVASARCVAS